MSHTSAKDAIIASFVKLLNTMSFDKITVAAIVRDCGVNRNTFYYYFKDTRDLLECIFVTITSDDMNVISQDNWEENLAQAIEYIARNKRAFYNLYRSNLRDNMEQYLYTLIGQRFMVFAQETAQELVIPRESLELICDFYKYAIVGLLLEWFRSGMKEQPLQLISRVAALFKGDFKLALQRAAEIAGQ